MVHDLDVEQGPRAGAVRPAELETYDDPHTGATVHRLTTDPDSDDRHLYFTADGWYDDGRRLLLRCKREGQRDLYSVDLETGQLTRLTDLEHGVGGCTRVNPEANEVYFAYSTTGGWYDAEYVLGLDVTTLEVRPVVKKPEGYDDYGFGVDDVLADDERLLVSVSENTDAEGHEATRATYPHCAIFAADIEGEDDAELIHEEEYWISHVNASPTRPELFTYCHEGPWDKVDTRIHIVNTETGLNEPLREVHDDEAVGHEYWLREGEYVGYHGWEGENDNEDCFHGTVKWDDTDRRETEIPVRRTHCHSNTRDRFVCDGDDAKVPFLLLSEYDEETETYETRKLATHAWDPDSPHPHARMSPDGETIAFDADPTGSDDAFLVEIPPFEDLPVYEDPTTLDRQ